MYLRQLGLMDIDSMLDNILQTERVRWSVSEEQDYRSYSAELRDTNCSLHATRDRNEIYITVYDGNNRISQQDLISVAINSARGHDMMHVYRRIDDELLARELDQVRLYLGNEPAHSPLRLVDDELCSLVCRLASGRITRVCTESSTRFELPIPGTETVVSIGYGNDVYTASVWAARYRFWLWPEKSTKLSGFVSYPATAKALFDELSWRDLKSIIRSATS